MRECRSVARGIAYRVCRTATLKLCVVIMMVTVGRGGGRRWPQAVVRALELRPSGGVRRRGRSGSPPARTSPPPTPTPTDDDQIPLYCDPNTTLGQGPDALCGNSDGVAVTPSAWTAISTNETEIGQQLYKIGPLSIALNAQRLQFYESGVFSPPSCK